VAIAAISRGNRLFPMFQPSRGLGITFNYSGIMAIWFMSFVVFVDWGMKAPKEVEQNKARK